MNLAKISANGQITVPIEIRRILNAKEGDKLLFVQKENGEIVVQNAAVIAILKAQEAFKGTAQNLGNPDEDDIQAWIDDMRYGKDGAIYN